MRLIRKGSWVVTFHPSVALRLISPASPQHTTAVTALVSGRHCFAASATYVRVPQYDYGDYQY